MEPACEKTIYCECCAQYFCRKCIGKKEHEMTFSGCGILFFCFIIPAFK